MRRFRIVSAGAVAAMAVALALGGVRAQTAPAQQVGKPALLVGLRPPHEGRHSVHAKTAHAAMGKTAAKKTRHARTAAEHRRHISARNIAKKEHQYRERAIAASAFAEEPSAQTAPNLALIRDTPAVDTVSRTASAAATAPATAPSNVDPRPDAMVVSGQSEQTESADQVNTLDLAVQRGALPATPPNDPAAVAPASTTQTALAAPVQAQEGQNAATVGSASWIAQVLAALGGAIAAGAVAWFLIGSGPVRTYG